MIKLHGNKTVTNGHCHALFSKNDFFFAVHSFVIHSAVTKAWFEKETKSRSTETERNESFANVYTSRGQRLKWFFSFFDIFCVWVLWSQSEHRESNKKHTQKTHDYHVVSSSARCFCCCRTKHMWNRWRHGCKKTAISFLLFAVCWNFWQRNEIIKIAMSLCRWPFEPRDCDCT